MLKEVEFEIWTTNIYPDRDYPPCDGARSALITSTWRGKQELRAGWTIEVSTLEELTALVKSEGKIVLFEKGIEIYNDYRE